MPIASDNGLIALRSQEFDGKVTGPVTLFSTHPTPFVPLYAIAYLRSVSGFTSVPTISLGTNSPSFNNTLPATALAALDAVGEYYRMPLGTVLANGVFRGQSATSSITIGVNVTVAAVATIYTLDLTVVGFYA